MDTKPRLTAISPGAGCGCKIAPDVLEQILAGQGAGRLPDPDLLVGYSHKDDAAVYRINDRSALVSTTDFFTPIVDDPYYYGRIAAVNALSDIYAMGGRPLTALAILAWPLDKLPLDLAREVVRGAGDAAAQAGIQIAGGHSIDIGDPVFGLAVTGIADIDCIRQNSGARAGDLVYLTKPLGTGILSTAVKRDLIQPGHYENMLDSMTRHNTLGMACGRQTWVHAMTDVTGFGLGGHLGEVCTASGLTARLEFQKLPFLPGLDAYLEYDCYPGGTTRNYRSYGHTLEGLSSEREKLLLCDPQTSGGLLVFIDPAYEQDFARLAEAEGVSAVRVGTMESAREGGILITIV